jgi:hypothetical protein
MRKKIFLIGMLVFTCAAAAVLPAEAVKTVQSDGIAVIRQGDIPSARDAALEDALRRAVEQAVGTLVESETLVENYDLLSDRIYTRSKGYVQAYDILTEASEETIYRVSIRARVSMHALEEDLDAVGVLMARMEKPRIMVMVGEGNIQNVNFWDHYVADISEAESEIVRQLREKGFYVVDAVTVRQNIEREQAIAAMTGDPEAASLLGRKHGSDVLVFGDAVATTGGSVARSDLLSCQASLNLRAVNTGTGEVIASASSDASAVHVNPTTGSQRAIRAAAETAAADLIRQILDQWRRDTGGMRTVGLHLTGISHEALNRLRQVMLENIRGLEDIRIRDFAEGQAYLEAEYRGTGMELAKALESLEWDMSIHLLGVTQNRLDARIEP